MKRYAPFLVFLLALLYRFGLSVQGIDNIDAGFCQTYYQNFFSEPELLTYYHLYYLTGLAGGLWEQWLGAWGLLGFRLLECVAAVGAVAFMYAAFLPWTGRRTGLAAAALCLLFPTMVTTFHYNTFSYLLCAIAVWLAARAMRSERNTQVVLLLFAAGVLWGFSFFARLVNLAWLSILPLLLLLGYFRQREGRLRRSLRYCLPALLGMMAGAAVVVFVLMPMTGHQTHFFQAVADAFGILGGETTSHTSGNLIFKYFKSLLNLLLQAAVVGVLWWASVRTPRWPRLVSVLSLTVFAVLAFTNNVHLTLLATCLLLTVCHLRRGEGALVCSTLLCMCIAFTFPIGSDTGISPVFQWAPAFMVMPAAAAARRLNVRPVLLTSAYAIIALLAVVKLAYRPYGEETPRWNDRQHIARAPLLNAYVNDVSAARYDSLLACIERYRQPRQPLLIVGQASQIFYATSMLPYLGNTQLGQYVGEQLRRRLDEQQSRFGTDPLVVVVRHGDDDEEVQAMLDVVEPWCRQRGITIRGDFLLNTAP